MATEKLGAVEPSKTYREVKKVLENMGFLISSIQPRSLEQLLAEEGEYFNYVDQSTNLRNFVPEAREIAIIPKVKLPESNNVSQARQIELIEDFGRKLLKDVRLNNIEVRMGHVAEYAQADITYQKQNDGKKLFPDFFARTLDLSVGLGVANVGRIMLVRMK